MTTKISFKRLGVSLSALAGLMGAVLLLTGTAHAKCELEQLPPQLQSLIQNDSNIKAAWDRRADDPCDLQTWGIIHRFRFWSVPRDPYTGSFWWQFKTTVDAGKWEHRDWEH